MVCVCKVNICTFHTDRTERLARVWLQWPHSSWSRALLPFTSVQMTTCRRRSKLALWIANRQQPTQTQHNNTCLYIIISAIPGHVFGAVQCHYFHFRGISERSIMILCRVWKRTISGTQVHRKTWDALGVGWGIWRCKPPQKLVINVQGW